MQCAPDSAHWPLLLTGRRAILAAGAESFTADIPFVAPRARPELLASLEMDLARGRRVEAPAWGPEGSVEFLERVFHAAASAGGLRLLSEGSSPPFEACVTLNRMWCDEFPLLRLCAPVAQRTAGSSGDVFIYSNPAGEPLPCARTEAETLLGRFKGRARAAFAPLAREELDEAIEQSSLIVYFGHARLIDGLPAIPTESGWMPLLSRQSGVLSGKVFVLGACLSEGASFVSPGGLFIHPVARISDRPSRFLLDLLEDFHPAGISEAWMRACRQDREAGDIRRIVFRMQGCIWF